MGEGVSAFAAGDRVLLEPDLVDGDCRYCSEGRYNLCEHCALSAARPRGRRRIATGAVPAAGLVTAEFPLSGVADAFAAAASGEAVKVHILPQA